MGALDGLKVLDLTSMVSGPVAAMMMADQGARVIKLSRLSVSRCDTLVVNTMTCHPPFTPVTVARNQFLWISNPRREKDPARARG